MVLASIIVILVVAIIVLLIKYRILFKETTKLFEENNFY